MKKLLLMITVLLFVINGFAQNLRDVVYLKSGSIIKGVIVEQIPNERLTIKSGENTFVYNMDEIERIAKEDSKISVPKEKCKYPNRGYRGFFDYGFGSGKDAADVEYKQNFINTIHGYQVNSHFFVGGGLGVHTYDNDDYDLVVTVPAFCNLRADLLPYAVSPYLDTRLGYAYGDIEGLYYSFALGVRINYLNISGGFVSQQYEYETNKKGDTDYGNVNALFFRISCEWGARRK